jgi:transcriptional regulator with XRE-family HTH domain
MSTQTKATQFAQWRASVGYSIREVAELTGTDESFISRLEDGSRSASPRMKVQMARRLRVRIVDLFDLEPFDDEESA